MIDIIFNNPLYKSPSARESAEHNQMSLHEKEEQVGG